ncbi:twin-arginine translocase subunit TatC [Actinotalea sp. M2MS4P-6]|uniref:twin-arginine translocase subunit TatC n=1 Tax=Actinotalea sp. M2MS4P-6 TaxID=2983762 RepID=UPI00296227FB|nr:twin-arginine translocase subunit TatC [Actinotalea sp. M2MS4P-6]
MDHVRELRNRALLAAAGLLVGAVVGWILYPPLFAALQRPVVELADERGSEVLLNFPGIGAPLDVQLKVALFAGAILSSPWWIYQLWAFVTPGLTKTERRYTLGFVGAAVPLFLLGAGVAWVLMPKAVAILTGFTPTGAGNIISATDYLEFVMRMVLAFGVAFLLPVLMVGLTAAGVVRARTWLAGWRWAVLLSAVFAAIATPTGDALTMLTLTVPMVALYFLAIGIGALFDRRRARRIAAEPA